MKRMRLLMVLLMFVIVLALQTIPAQATRVVGAWAPIYQGIWYATGTDDTPLMKAFFVKVDLQNANVSLLASHDNGTAAYEVARETPTAFLNAHGLKVAVNASFFNASLSPNTDVWGLLASNGTIVSPPDYAAPFNSYISFTSAKAGIVGAGNSVPAGCYNAVAGAEITLSNGANLGWDSDPQPATSYGLSQDGRYMIIGVVDGRQAGWSNGATPYQMVRWMIDFGAYNGIKMDGGGSSCMTIAGMGSYVNRPSDGYARAVGASMGVLSTAIPVTEIIIDNPAGVATGTWTTGTSSTDKYGTDYRYRSAMNTGTENFVWRPNITTAGNYAVYAWWPQGSNRSVSTPYTVYYNGGSQLVRKDQTINGGMWNLIGTYSFAVGTAGYVKVTPLTSPYVVGKQVMADAVRFVKQ